MHQVDKNKTLSNMREHFSSPQPAAAWSQQPASKQAPDPCGGRSRNTHLELDNQWVRVFQERDLGPHGTMPMHQHPARSRDRISDRPQQSPGHGGSAKIFIIRPGMSFGRRPPPAKSENPDRCPVCGAPNRTQTRRPSEAFSKPQTLKPWIRHAIKSCWKTDTSGPSA